MANHKSRDFSVPSETKICAIKFLEALLRNSYYVPRYHEIPLRPFSSIDAHSKVFGYIYSYNPIEQKNLFIEKIFTPPYDIMSIFSDDVNNQIIEKITCEEKIEGDSSG